jgi:hypothetical protein
MLHLSRGSNLDHPVVTTTTIIINLIFKRVPDRVDVNSKKYKFTLLDGSRCLHISDSTVSISYVSLPDTSGELGKGTAEKW